MELVSFITFPSIQFLVFTTSPREGKEGESKAQISL